MQGQLFTQDFLTRGIKDTPPYQALDDATFARFKASVMTAEPISTADRGAREPLKVPMAVLTALAMTTSLISIHSFSGF